MNKILSSAMAWLMALMLCTLALAGCMESEPLAPTNELESKEHEDPSRAIFTLTEGVLREGVSWDNAPTHEGFRPTGKTQSIVMQDSPDKGWSVAPESPAYFEVKNSHDHPELVYLLEIEYFNPKGELMNEQFVALGQDKLHQHFFIYYGDEGERGRIVTNEEELPYSYRYVDLDARGRDMGQSNPMGFSGLLRFAEGVDHFDLSVELLHASQSKYVDGQGKTAPYFLPTIAQRGESWDIKTRLHIHVEGEGHDHDDHHDGDDDHDPNHGDGEAHEEDHHHHDEGEVEPVKAVLRFAQGHLHGVPNFHQDTERSAKHLKILQTFTYLKDEHGHWELSPDSQQKLYAQAASYSSPVYALWIEYYDEHGHSINGSYIDKGADREHQHFFLARQVSPAYGGQAEEGDHVTANIFDYVYADTTPWHKTKRSGQATFNGANNPLGFKGYFTFRRPYKTFSLDIVLSHMSGGKLDASGRASTYDKPTMSQLSSVDIRLSLPVHVYMDKSDYLQDVGMQDLISLPESQYSQRDRRVVRLYMEAFGISWQEVVRDLDAYYNGNIDSEAGSLWF